MVAGNVKQDSHYRHYVELLIELHKLMRDGRSETNEADEIRDQMDEPWYGMEPAEVERSKGISADLASLEPDSPYAHPVTGGIRSAQVAQTINAARASSEYEGILQTLRDRSESVSADRAAFLRGWCYEHLGEPEVAELFYQHAAKLDRENDLYAVFA